MENNKFQSGLFGKRILLLIPAFYDYHLLVKDELEKQGAHVEMVINEMHKEDFRSSTNYLLTFLYFLINPGYKQNFTKNLLRKLEGKPFDILFAVNGFSVTKELIERLKERNPLLKTTIFFWDSFFYWKYYNLIPLFDVAFSFDRKDCETFKELGLRYHPDFYVSQNLEPSSYTYDITCIASLNKFTLNRLKVLRQVSEQAKKLGLKCYFRIYHPSVRFSLSVKSCMKVLTNKVDRILFYNQFLGRMDEFLVSEKISLKEVEAIEHASYSLLDVPPPNQNGLTIRSLEAIAAGKKLITTNKIVQNEEFYVADNILFIEHDQKTLDPTFFKRKTVHVDISSLKLNNWVRSILNSDNCYNGKFKG